MPDLSFKRCKKCRRLRLRPCKIVTCLKCGKKNICKGSTHDRLFGRGLCN